MQENIYLSISILKDFILLFILRFVGSLSAVAVKCEIYKNNNVNS